MNPFEDSADVLPDSKVLAYFARIQKRDPCTRSKAFQEILQEIDVLDCKMLQRCLFDTLPLLCNSQIEQTLPYISRLLLHLLTRNCFDRVEQRLGTWLKVFLPRQDEAGVQLLALLARKKKLDAVLQAFLPGSEPRQWLAAKIIEAQYIRSPELDANMLRKIDTSREEITGLFVDLIRKIKEKHSISRDQKQAAVHSVLSRMPEMHGHTWALNILLGVEYSLESLARSTAHIPLTVALDIFLSDRFSLLLRVQHTSEQSASKQQQQIEQQPPTRIDTFIQECARIHPAAFGALSRLGGSRSQLLHKIIGSNPAEALDMLDTVLARKDFPGLNEIMQPTKVNSILQRMSRILPGDCLEDISQAPEVYEGLSPVEKIERADILGGKMEDIDPAALGLGLEALRASGVLQAALRTFPAEYFRSAIGLTDEEKIYAAIQNPAALCTREVLDLLFRYSIYPQEILGGMPRELHAHLLSHMEQQPLEALKEIYEGVREALDAHTDISFLSLLFRVPEYSRRRFGKPVEVHGLDACSPEYVYFLYGANAVSFSWIATCVAELASSTCSGSLDLSDDYTMLSDYFSDHTEQANSPFLFERARARWLPILNHIESQEALAREARTEKKEEACSSAPSKPRGVPEGPGEDGQVLAQIRALKSLLGTASEIPLHSLGDLVGLRSLEVFARAGAAQEVLRGMLFYASLAESTEYSLDKGGKVRDYWPDALARLHKKHPKLASLLIELASTESSRYKSTYDTARLGSRIEEALRSTEVPDTGDKSAEEALGDLSAAVYVVARLLAYIPSRESPEWAETWRKLCGLAAGASRRVLAFCILSAPKHCRENTSLDYTYLPTTRIALLEMEADGNKALLGIKTDTSWSSGMSAYRYAAYAPHLRGVAQHYASAVLNMYSIARTEKEAIDAEIFHMMFGIPALGPLDRMGPFEWRVFLLICTEIRSIELCSLISSMVRVTCKWMPFLVMCEAQSLELFGLFAQCFPVLAGSFYRNCKSKRRIQQYFVSSVTEPLIRTEAAKPLQGVQLSVKSIGESHILVALYRIEESALEVNILFPKDYPLSAPSVKVVKCIGVKKQRLQRVLLRVQILLSEHCRIGEALVLWKLAMDDSVSEVDECGICFFLIDEVSSFFPDVVCGSCGNRFHKTCIQKWLHRTANQCPVCRSEIREN